MYVILLKHTFPHIGSFPFLYIAADRSSFFPSPFTSTTSSFLFFSTDTTLFVVPRSIPIKAALLIHKE